MNMGAWAHVQLRFQTLFKSMELPLDNIRYIERKPTVCSQCTGVTQRTHFRILLPGLVTRALFVRSLCTGVPAHTRRILLPVPATRSLPVRSLCPGVPVHTRRILLPGLTPVPVVASSGTRGASRRPAPPRGSGWCTRRSRWASSSPPCIRPSLLRQAPPWHAAQV